MQNSLTTAKIIPIADASGLKITKANGTTDVLVMDTTNARVGVNCTPEASLDIANGKYATDRTMALRIGADIGALTRTNNTRKLGLITAPHYSTGEQDMVLMSFDANGTYNSIYLGGGNNASNCATELLFYTAADVTTLGGTERMRITSGGLVGIGCTPAYDLDVGTSTKASATYTMVRSAANQQAGFGWYSATTQQWLLYRPASSTDLRLYDGTTDRVTFANGGNVGIGCTPSNALDVVGNLRIGNSTASTGYGWLFYGNELDSCTNRDSDETGYINWRGYNLGSTRCRSLSICDGKANQIALFDGTTKYVGIGCTPSYKLHCYASSGTPCIRLESGSMANHGDDMLIEVSGTHSATGTAGIGLYVNASYSAPSGYIKLFDAYNGSNTCYLWVYNGMLYISSTKTNIGSNTGTIVGQQP